MTWYWWLAIVLGGMFTTAYLIIGYFLALFAALGLPGSGFTKHLLLWPFYLVFK